MKSRPPEAIDHTHTGSDGSDFVGPTPEVQQAPPGGIGRVQAYEHLERLDRAECMRLLEGGSLGRIGTVVRGQPMIFPINYVALDGAIVFRIRRGGDLETAVGTQVAFEIDGTDIVYHEGWSVLVVGRCVGVTDPVELDRIRSSRLSSWVGRDQDRLVELPVDEISGRRIRHRGS